MRRKRHKKESIILGSMLKKLGKQMDAEVIVEPEWGIAGSIHFKNGKRSYFRYNTLDLNPVGASDIAKDKDYANFFMRKMGYPTVEGKTFFADWWADAIGSKRDAKAAARYAGRRFPLVVKPNSGSQGQHVSFVYNKKELWRALKNVFTQDRVALVQKVARGKDYRIVVLDNEIISAYERIPLNVTGDGHSTIKQLLIKKQHEFNRIKRDTRIKLNDPRITGKLKYQGRTLVFVPAHEQQVFLLDNANLSSGGDSIDVTNTIHAGFKKLAIKLTKDMGLRLCGVDLMVDGDITKQPKKYNILEINAAPGLDHYVKTGKAQEKIVEDLYLKVLKHLAK